MHRAVAVLVLTGLLAGCNSSSNQVQVYNLGDRVQAGPLIYSAYDTHWYVTLGPPENPRIPNSRFMVIRMMVTNSGATDSTVPTLTLIDDSGQSYNELADGSGVPDWLGVIRKIKPMESERGNVAFDVAPRHYKLRVADETGQIVSDIDVPLNVLSDEKQ